MVSFSVLQKDKFRKYIPLFIFFFALAMRVLIIFIWDYGSIWARDGLPMSDAREYDILAMNILEGRGYGNYLYGFKYQSFVCPLYPLFLAFIYSFLGHNFLAVKIVQLILSSLTAVITYDTARMIFNRSIGIISGMIIALYLPYILWVRPIMRETFFIFIFGLAFWSIIKALRTNSRLHLGFSGVLIGLSVLTRPGGLLLLPVLIIGGLINLKGRRVVLIGLIAFLTVAPWLIRSMLVHEGTILLESSGSRHFWTGANPEYRGSFYSRNAWHKSLWEEPFVSESERSKRLNREAINFVKKGPWRYFRFAKTRINFFWHLPRLKEIRFDLRSRGHWLPYLLFWLAFLGALHSFRYWRQTSFLILLILFYSLGAGIYGGTERYRLPLEQFMIIFSAYSIYILAMIHHQEWRTCSFNASSSQLETGAFLSAKLKRSIGLISLLPVLIFTLEISGAYFDKQEVTLPKIDAVKIKSVLAKRNLLEEYEKEGTRHLTYQDIFLDQAQHRGFITKYEKHLVVWPGRMSYIVKDKKGRMRNFRFVLNSAPHSFGQENLYCHPAKGINIEAEQFKEDDIVAVIGRIATQSKKLLEDPRIEFYEVIPLD